MKNCVVLRWLAIGIGAFLCASHAKAQVATNDSFSSRIVITLSAPTVSASNVGATKETGEPNHAGNIGGKSLWWTWVAPATGSVKINTIGSSFDTTLGIYTGTSVSNLTTVASNDDGGGGGSGNSLVTLNAIAGTTYQIAVDGFDGASGSIVLTIDALPAIIGPTTVAGTVGLFFTTNVIATNNPIYFQASGLPAGMTINSGSGVISGTPSAGGSYPVSLLVSNVFGSATTNLTFNVDTAPVITSSSTAAGAINQAFNYTITALNDPTGFGASPLPSGLSVNTTNGLISGVPTANGVYVVTLSATNASTFRTKQLTISIGTANDNFAGAVPLSGTGQVTGSNASATKEPGEPDHFGNTGGKSVWWALTPSASGVLNIDTIGSSFDTLLAVYTGNSVSSLTEVVSNDDSGEPGGVSLVSFSGVAGTTYYIAVDGFDGVGGNIVLNISALPTITSPTNASGTVGASFSYTITALNNPTNFGASPLPGGLSLNPTSGLISGTPTAAGSFVIKLSATNGFGFATTNLSLLIDLTPIFTSKNNTTGQVGVAFSFTLTALNDPTNYSATGLPTGLSINGSVISGVPQTNGIFNVQVAATNSSGGATSQLTIRIRPENDDFVDAFTMSLATNSVTANNAGATKETGEPNHTGAVGGTSLWWTWTSPGTGPVKIHTMGSTFDTSLAVYTGSSVSNLTLRASDDESGGNTTSLLTLNAVSGTAYRIAVDGFSGASGNMRLTIDALPTITSGTNAEAVLDQPFTYTITAENDPTSFQAVGLPSGFSLNSGSGIISGTATSTGTNQITLVASNSFGTATNFLTLRRIGVPPPSITPSSVMLIEGQFQFQFFGYPETTYAVQISTNLLNWTTLLTTNGSGNQIEIVELNPNLPQRFYRVTIP